MNITVLEKTKCMRLNARLSKSLCTKLVNYAWFVTNQSPSTTINFKVPMEVWSCKLIDYSMLRIFGYPIYAHMQSGEWLKLDSKSVQCICLCLESIVKGYRILDLISKKNIFSKYVVFDGGYMLRKCEDEALTESHKGKQVMEVEIVYQHPLTDIYDDEESLRDP